MSRTHKGYYSPKNVEKYIGNHDPIYRSSWELSFMRTCDEHPGIIEWASEPFRIPFYHPIYNKYSIYVPDFLIVYIDANKVKHGDVIEIKPLKETVLEKAKSRKDKIQWIINSAKWEAAERFCKKNGLKFQVLNESQLFKNPRT